MERIKGARRKSVSHEKFKKMKNIYTLRKHIYKLAYNQ